VVEFAAVKPMRVAVVGGGLAGLAAATELKELGHRVELFERSRLLGGRATSFEIDGVEVDNGQHVFLACCTEFLRFARRAGFDANLYLQPRFDALVLARDGRRGRLRAASLPAPLHLLASFATYPYLSFAGKLRIGRAIVNARSQASGTFEQWLQRTGQSAETRRSFWNPFFIPALNAPFDRVSVDDALFTLRTAFLGDPSAARFGYAKVPLAHLAAAAASKLDAVHLSTGVTRVVADDAPGVTLSLSKGDEARSFDAVVLAVPPRVAAKLLDNPSRFGVEGLDQYDPYPILDVHLWHDAGSIGFDFAAALDSPLQWIFEKAPGYLSCSFSAAQEHMQRPTAELEAFAWQEAKAFVRALRGATLVRSAVTRNPEATWLPRLGAKRTRQQTAFSNVAIAGSWTDTGWPDTMESAIRSGIAAARALANVSLRPDRVGYSRETAPRSASCLAPASPLFAQHQRSQHPVYCAKSWRFRFEHPTPPGLRSTCARFLVNP
jgi:squalene-associated FAD-dependent desaturase